MPTRAYESLRPDPLSNFDAAGDFEPTRAYSPLSDDSQPSENGPPPAVSCRTCGKALADPFDVAVGMCGDCRSKSMSEAGDEAFAASASPPSAEAGPKRNPPAPLSSYDQGPVHNAAREDGGEGGRNKVMVVTLAALLLGVGGAVLLAKRPWKRRAPTLAIGTVAKEIDAVVPKWKASVGALEKTAEQYLVEGEAKLAEDSTSGYQEAEESFQKALVKDPSSDRAVAGYVGALALGRGTHLDDAAFDEALGLIVAAEARRGADVGELLAHAHLLLTRPTAGNASDARALAERAQVGAKPQVQAQAHLVIGLSYLGTNWVWASENLDKVLVLFPDLRRGYLARARAFHSEGDLRKAIGLLEKRLALDGDQWEATELLARLYVEAGETGAARSVLERFAADRKNVRSRIALAVLAYQHEGRAEEGAELLDQVVAEKGSYGEQELVDALGHLSAAVRVLGELDEAEKFAQAALAVDAKDANAHLQLFLVAVQRGLAEQARLHLPALQGQLGNEALERVLEGRLLLLEGKAEEALEVFGRAAELDHRRTDALLLAAAAAATARQERKAYDFALQRALRADPERAAAASVLAPYFVAPSDTLGGALERFRKLSSGKDDPNPPLCEGLVRFHLEDHAGADRELAKVVTIDPGNGPALALRSLIALRRGQTNAAVKLGARAVGADRTLALTHYAYGAALLAQRKDDAAKQALRDALSADPKLLAPRVKLAEAHARTGNLEEARRLLSSVVGIDSAYFDAKRALYVATR
ncbi:MAG: tetratricopeptide repeat protein [Myxococcota bacterium]